LELESKSVEQVLTESVQVLAAIFSLLGIVYTWKSLVSKRRSMPSVEAEIGASEFQEGEAIELAHRKGEEALNDFRSTHPMK
jgi:hypothetical protein